MPQSVEPPGLGIHSLPRRFRGELRTCSAATGPYRRLRPCGLPEARDPPSTARRRRHRSPLPDADFSSKWMVPSKKFPSARPTGHNPANLQLKLLSEIPAATG
jgi:hypothetical protein